MDRTIALARSFIVGISPSFTSFNDHKKFFSKPGVTFGGHEEYAAHLRAKTDWFEMPLKLVRDKFVIHAAPRHMRFLGFPDAGFELDLSIILPEADGKDFANVRYIRVNAIRLSHDIGGFLAWFNAYGVAAMKRVQA
jgi:hypothetical protein